MSKRFDLSSLGLPHTDMWDDASPVDEPTLIRWVKEAKTATQNFVLSGDTILVFTYREGKLVEVIRAKVVSVHRE